MSTAATTDTSALQAEIDRLNLIINALRPVAEKYRRDTECTSYPWWAITQRAAFGRYAVLCGPFLNREEAEQELNARRYHYGKKATVFCFSGYASDGWRQVSDAFRAIDARSSAGAA